MLNLVLTLAVTAAPAEREVTVGALHGTLLTPDKLVTRAAVLIIAGSGPTDRDGNSAVPGVKPASYKLLADGLAARGITSLRYDKRGVGASKAALTAEADVRFDDYVADAVAFAAELKRQPGVSCVVLFGHSEGALIAAVAAPAVKPCGVVSASGAGRSVEETVTAQLKASGVPEATMAQVAPVFGELRAGRLVPQVPATDPLFRPAIEPYLISWMRHDPVKSLKAAPGPVLILQGERDIQVPPDDARRLAASRPDAQLVIVSGMSHVLKPAPADRAGNVATYADPNLPLSPEVVPEVAAFVERAGADH